MEVKKTPPSADLNRAYPPPASQLLQLVPDKTAGSLFAEKYPERELRSPSSHIPYGVGGGGGGDSRKRRAEGGPGTVRSHSSCSALRAVLPGSGFSASMKPFGQCCSPPISVKTGRVAFSLANQAAGSWKHCFSSPNRTH